MSAAILLAYILFILLLFNTCLRIDFLFVLKTVSCKIFGRMQMFAILTQNILFSALWTDMAFYRY